MAIDAALGRLGIKEGVCTSSTRPANPFEGQLIYETDTNRTLVYDNSAWLVVADNQVLSIDPTNSRVGIGTTSPQGSISVDSSNRQWSVTNDSTNYVTTKAHATDDASSLVFHRQSASRHHFSLDGATDAMLIDSSGNVGINDSTPSYTLDVNGDINTTGDVRVAGNALPRGVVAQGRNTTPANLTTSFQDYVSLTFTGVAGRRYLAFAMIGAYSFNNSGVFEAQIINSTDGDRYATLLLPIPNTSIDYVSGSIAGTFTATGSNTVILRAIVFGGATSGEVITTLSSDPQLQIIDIGEA